MGKTALSVGVIGATGLVGQEMVEILDERRFPVASLHPFASEHSAGATLSFQNKDVSVKALRIGEKDVFAGLDLVLGATDSKLARAWVPLAVSAGCLVIDNSSAFRMEADVPLVIPEVNGHLLSSRHHLIANPNCSTAQLVMVLKPLHDAAILRRVSVTTFQSVSGTGKAAVDELMYQTQAILSFKEAKREVYQQQIAFNCIVDWPCDPITGDSEEETKIIAETRKILDIAQLPVFATTVRVPVLRSHAESVHIETEKRLSANEARAILAAAPGITVYDDPKRKIYPTPLDVVGQDNVYVGRVREDHAGGIYLWVVADNLRKGAALNAVQIAEYLLKGSNGRLS